MISINQYTEPKYRVNKLDRYFHTIIDRNIIKCQLLGRAFSPFLLRTQYQNFYEPYFMDFCARSIIYLYYVACSDLQER